MKVLKATKEQKELIESQTKGNHLIRFTNDADGNWIVGAEVLNDPKFNQIYFSGLVEIKYNPIVEDGV